MAKRKSISKKIRFEVFKRDSFTCQYCGVSAPDVTLQVDHIVPVSKGGKDDIINLVTSCVDCNAGKSDRELNDKSVVRVRQAQARKLQDRREQLKMLMEWHEGQKSINDDAFHAVLEYFEKHTGYGLTEDAQTELKKMVSRFGVKSLLEAIDIGVSQYLPDDFHDEQYRDGVNKLFTKLSGICWNRQDPLNNASSYITRLLCPSTAYTRSNWGDKSRIHGAVKRAGVAGLSLDLITSIGRASLDIEDFEAKIESAICDGKLCDFHESQNGFLPDSYCAEEDVF